MNTAVKINEINVILARFQADEKFKHQLLADPTTVLRTEGANIPEGYTVRVLENTDKVFHFVIPERPTDLSDEMLEKLAAGTGAIDANCYRTGKLL